MRAYQRIIHKESGLVRRPLKYSKFFGNWKTNL
jgi:hypothetical protein